MFSPGVWLTNEWHGGVARVKQPQGVVASLALHARVSGAGELQLDCMCCFGWVRGLPRTVFGFQDKGVDED